MVSGEDEDEGEGDPAHHLERMLFVILRAPLHCIQSDFLAKHNHFLISWDLSLIHLKISSHPHHYLETN